MVDLLRPGFLLLQAKGEMHFVCQQLSQFASGRFLLFTPPTQVSSKSSADGFRPYQGSREMRRVRVVQQATSY